MDADGAGRRGVAAFLACVACVITAAVAPGVAVAEPAPGQAGWIFDPGKVVVIDLTLSPEAEEALEDEPDEYVKGGFSLYTTDGVPGGVEEPVGSPLTEVGIKLKGHASFKPLSAKAAFKIKFKEFSGPKFEGLKKLTLNNMVEDTSMIHETLAYEAFRAAGVPASRTGYAYVRVNGADYGLYANVETLDDVALERWFGKFEEPPQHLYEGEDGHDVTPGGATAFEVDEGEEGNRADLEALIAAAGGPVGGGWSTQLAPVAELEEMTRMWAVEKFVGQWDGYAGQEGEHQPSNYFLYSDPLGRFQMLPWGTDETWVDDLAFDGPAGLMFNRCLADPACEALYRRELRAAGKAIAGLGLDTLAQSTDDLLKPWEELDPRREYSIAEIDDAVAAARDFIARRSAELEAWLGPEVAQEAEPPGGSATASRVSLPPIATAPLLRLRIGAAIATGGVLRNRLRLPAAGQVRQRVSIETKRGALRVCSAHAQAERAGAVTLRCRLPALALEHLRARWLRLSIAVRFTPSVGDSETTVAEVVLPRTDAPGRRGKADST